MSVNLTPLLKKSLEASKIAIYICFVFLFLLHDNTKNKIWSFTIREGTILSFLKNILHGTLEKRYFGIWRIVGDVTKSDWTKTVSI